MSQNIFQLLQGYSNITKLDEEILHTTRNYSQTIINALSNLQGTSNTAAGVLNSTLQVVQALLLIHNDSTSLPNSCKEVKERQPNSLSGVYLLATASGDGTYKTYCHMGELCSLEGEWTRLAYLDMSDSTQNCPPGFKLYQSGSVRACGRPVTYCGMCVSVYIPNNGISYSHVCGRVVGYQYGTPDASLTPPSFDRNRLDSHYIDGISITMGPPPRKHVWSLMAGHSEKLNTNTNCPCNAGSQASVQSIIGNNYFCESGNPNSTAPTILYSSDPLWDGQNCGSLEASCCSAPNLPWFHRKFNTSTTDYLELRVCGNAQSSGEDVPVSFYEIHVQ